MPNKNQLKMAMVVMGAVATLGYVLNATRGNKISDNIRGGYNV